MRNLKIKKTKGFSLPEMMVALALMSVFAVGMFNGLGQLKKNIVTTKSQITARKDLAPFCHTLNAFANRSLAAYFWDSTNNVEFDYVSNFSTLTPGDSMLDTVDFVKNTAGNPIANLIYDPNNFTISWRKSSSSAATVILEDVYRIDYVDETDTGTAPVFRFPHIQTLYDTATRPRLITLEFKIRVMEPTAHNPNPLMIPVKLISQVNTLQQ